jgi:2-polyprenyl-3-methyl-5-hydroxy-6-metoxy-1,4-benzoquinol methylase
VTSREYVRRYFSDSARQWLARAYDDVDETAAYPVGAQRTRLALEAVVDRLGTVRGHLVDLGCGGGDLALRAADLGFRATGVDLAEGMIVQAEARRTELAADARDRVSFRVADVLETGLPAGCADAVTAIGLVEYLAADEPFLAEAARLLRAGGVLVVSCRNRLFNATSGNQYTREEIEAGSVAGLLDELAALRPDRAVVPLLWQVVARLREALPGLERALAKDAEGEGARSAQVPPVFGQRRRQHSPAGFAAAVEAAGFKQPRFFGVHPHVLTPALEAVAPRFYNRLAAALEPLESAPVSLAWSSAFLGVFTR